MNLLLIPAMLFGGALILHIAVIGVGLLLQVIQGTSHVGRSLVRYADFSLLGALFFTLVACVLGVVLMRLFPPALLLPFAAAPLGMFVGVLVAKSRSEALRGPFAQQAPQHGIPKRAFALNSLLVLVVSALFLALFFRDSTREIARYRNADGTYTVYVGHDRLLSGIEVIRETHDANGRIGGASVDGVYSSWPEAQQGHTRRAGSPEVEKFSRP